MQQRFRPRLELLEDRTVPATLISPTTVTWQDADGDLARAFFSQPVLSVDTVNSLFDFTSGDVDGSNAFPQQLGTLNLTNLTPTQTQNLSVTLSVTKKHALGDGQVHVQFLISSNSLNSITIQGDLGSYYLYSSTSPTVLQQLQTQSLGRFGPQNGASFLDSTATGYIGKFKVNGDVGGRLKFATHDDQVSTQVVGTLEIGGSLFGIIDSNGSMGTVKIGKNIDGTQPDKAYLTPFQAPGQIYIPGTVGQFTVGGALLGGDDDFSGFVNLGNSILADTVNTLSIGGNLQGGFGYGSGQLLITGIVNSWTIGGSIVGGTGDSSGRFQTNGARKAMLNGSLVGGAGYQSGQLNNYPDQDSFSQTSFTMKGNIVGGAGDFSGWLSYWGTVQQMKLGAVQGGAGFRSGWLLTEAIIDQLTTGDIVGGSGEESGQWRIFRNGVRLATVGNLLGGPSVDTGKIQSFGTLSELTVKNITGGGGDRSGRIALNDPDMKKLTITGTVQGGSGELSGTVEANLTTSFLLKKDLVGGEGLLSGIVYLTGTPTIEIQGSIRGGGGQQSGGIEYYQALENEPVPAYFKVLGNIVGGAGDISGQVLYTGPCQAITLGSIVGGAGFESGWVDFRGQVFPTLNVRNIQGSSGQRSGTLVAKATQTTVQGSILGGTGYEAGTIRFYAIGNQSIDTNATLKVLGSIVGGTVDDTGRLLTDGTADITIVGSVVGGAGHGSGRILSFFSSLGTQSLTIQGDIKGGTGTESGYVNYNSPLTFAKLGSIIGGNADDSGRVFLEADCPSIVIKKLVGGGGYRSGTIEAFNDSSMTHRFKATDIITGGTGYYSGNAQLYGSYLEVAGLGGVKGGSGDESGAILVTEAVDQLTLGSLVGGTGNYSGRVAIRDSVRNARVNGSLLGGIGEQSGSLWIERSIDFTNIASVDTLTVTGSIKGSGGVNSGVVYAANIERTYVAGSIVGGVGNSAGGILADFRLGSVRIDGNLVGYENGNGGYVAVVGNTDDDRILERLSIGGSILSGLVYSHGVIGTIDVAGSITGSNSRFSLIQANGFDKTNRFPLRSPTLERLTVGKDVKLAGILVGTVGIADGVARFGWLNVGRNWERSGLVVGYQAGDDGLYGTADDVRVDENRASLIDSVFIGGKVVGSASENLLQASQIDKATIGGTKLPLTPGAFNDAFTFGGNLPVLETVTL